MKGWRRRGVALLAATTASVVLTGWPPGSPTIDGSREVGSGLSLESATFDSMATAPKLPPSGQAAITSPAAPPSAPAAEAAIAPPPAAFSGPAARPAPPPAALRQASASKAGGTWAVVIGINDYPGNGADLKSAVNDANDVVQALGGLGVPGDRILVLRDGQATAGNIRAALGWLASRASAESVSAFFFAGHVRKGGPGGEQMVAADGNGIDDVELASRLRKVDSREAWIGIAACYGGGFAEVLEPGRVLTGAAGANEIAYENSGFGRSYMVEFMIRQAIVEQKAADNVQISFRWAREQLQRDYPNRVPVQFDQSDGVVDLRPAGTPAKPPPPKNPPPSSPPPSSPPSTQPPRQDCTEAVAVSWCS